MDSRIKYYVVFINGLFGGFWASKQSFSDPPEKRSFFLRAAENI